MAVPLPNNSEIFTYGDYVNWPDNERWELIEGIPFDMTPAPARIHQEILGNLFLEMNRVYADKEGGCKIYLAPFDVRFPKGKEPDAAIINVVQPDLSVICDASKLDDKGCKGAPDVVVEIISPFTAKKDLEYKLKLYEKHRIPEYWVVHPHERTVMVYRLNEQNKYDHAEVYGQEDVIPLSLLDNILEVNLQSVFAG